MKYLSDYMNDLQTEAFEKYGAFFAFSQSQMAEKQIKCVRYSSMGAGLICPSVNVASLSFELNCIHKESIQKDIEENGIKAIIHRELGNYEVQITGDLSDTRDALEPYGIDLAQIKMEYKSFYQKCVDNDWF